MVSVLLFPVAWLPGLRREESLPEHLSTYHSLSQTKAYGPDEPLHCGVAIPMGIPKLAAKKRTVIFGTKNHTADTIADTSMSLGPMGECYAIDMSKPGATEYIDSVVSAFAEWAVWPEPGVRINGFSKRCPDT